jgi:hypothetical protein
LKKNSKQNLAEIIAANPNCHAVVDNDCWWLYRVHPDQNPHDHGSDEADAWDDKNEIARDSTVAPVGSGYGSGCQYGGDLLQALAKLQNMTIESV